MPLTLLLPQAAGEQHEPSTGPSKPNAENARNADGCRFARNSNERNGEDF